MGILQWPQWYRRAWCRTPSKVVCIPGCSISNWADAGRTSKHPASNSRSLRQTGSPAAKKWCKIKEMLEEQRMSFLALGSVRPVGWKLFNDFRSRVAGWFEGILVWIPMSMSLMSLCYVNPSAVKSLFMNRPPRNHVGMRCPMGIPDRKSPAQNTAQVKTALANGTQRDAQRHRI